MRGFAGSSLAALAAAILVAAAPGEAAELKLGFMDSSRIFEEYTGAKEAQDLLARESREWETKAEELKSAFVTSAEELEGQRLMLSEERLKQRERDVAEKRRTYEDYVASIWGQDGRVAQRNSELTKPIIDKVNEVLHRICTEEGYSLVLDAAGGNIVYGLPALDMTDRILQELAKVQQ